MCKPVVRGIYIAAIQMIENNEYLTDYLVIIKWSHFDVMRLSLSLGA